MTNKNTPKKLKMKDDVVFKAFFSKKENNRYLKEFLESILGENLKIKRVIHDSQLEQLALEDKFGILDLEVELADGKIINIELQRRDYKNIEKRTTFYAAKKVVEQLSPGDKFDEIKKVIIIAILDYSFIELPEYFIKTKRVIEGYSEYELNNEVEYYYIELDKFREARPDMKKPLNRWLAFIDMEKEELLEMAKKESKVIRDAITGYEVLTGEANLKRLEEVRFLDSLERGDAMAFERKEGKKEKAKEIAKKMLMKKMPIEDIIELTGLTKEEIEKL